MSTYYADPLNNPKLIQDDEFCISMDMEQMLIIMDEVFSVQCYVYCIDGDKITVAPNLEYNNELWNLVNEENAILQRERILKFQYELHHEEYQKINQYDYIAKRNLYLLNLLTSHVNGYSKLGERDSLIYFLLFNDNGGKRYFFCAMSLLFRLLISMKSGKDEVNIVIKALNRSYETMKQIFNGEEVFWERFANRKKDMENSYIFEKGFFAKESAYVGHWIEKRREIKKTDIWSIVFYNMNSFRNLTMHIMLHMTKISRELFGEDCVGFVWEKDLKEYNFSNDFWVLDKQLEDLGEKKKAPEFNINNWVDQYISQLKKVYEEFE